MNDDCVWLDDDPAGVGSRPALTIDPEVERPSESEIDDSRAPSRKSRVRHVCAGAGPPTRLQPSTQVHRLLDLEHVGKPIVGVRSGRYVVRPDELGVHHEHDRSAPPAAADYDVGGGNSAPSLDLDTQEIDRGSHDLAIEAIRRSTTEGAGKVSSDESE